MGTFPFTYLGVPIGTNMSLKKHYKPIIEWIRSKLSSWRSKALSFGERLTLVKVVLESFPTYYFSLFKASYGIFKKLERIRRKFLWSSDGDKSKIHWVSWQTVIAPKCRGGLRVGSLKIQNHTLLAKWWRKLRSDDNSLWCNTIHSIHNTKRKLAHWISNKSVIGT